jgi:hypothetical protein
MKRILYGAVLVGVLASAVTALGQTPKHHAEKAADVAASPVSSGSQLKMSAATCSGTNPANCPASCRSSAAGASAGRVASH